MNAPTRSPVTELVQRNAGRLRHPYLLALLLALLVLDVVIPDVLPFVDELLLALLAALVGSRRKAASSSPDEPPRLGADPGSDRT